MAVWERPRTCGAPSRDDRMMTPATAGVTAAYNSGAIVLELSARDRHLDPAADMETGSKA